MRCTFTAIMIIILVGISGCAKSFKAYSGPDLTTDKVALVKLAPYLVFVGTDFIDPKRPITGANVSLLPGMRIIKIGSTSDRRVVTRIGNYEESVPLSLITFEFGGYRVIDLYVEAGHTYFIKSIFRGNTWITPVFDIGNGKEVEATVYDGMLKPGTERNPQRPYRRK